MKETKYIYICVVVYIMIAYIDDMDHRAIIVSKAAQLGKKIVYSVFTVIIGSVPFCEVMFSAIVRGVDMTFFVVVAVGFLTS